MSNVKTKNPKIREARDGSYCYLTKYIKKNRKNIDLCEKPSRMDDRHPDPTDTHTINTYLSRPHVRAALKAAKKFSKTSVSTMISVYKELAASAKRRRCGTANITQQALADAIGASLSAVNWAIKGLRYVGLIIPELRYAINKSTGMSERITSLVHLSGYFGWVRYLEDAVKEAVFPVNSLHRTVLGLNRSSLRSDLCEDTSPFSASPGAFSFDPGTGEIFSTGGGGGKAGMVYQGDGK